MSHSVRLMFTRPLYLAISLGVVVELINYFIFSVIMGSGEHLLPQFLWMVAFGGIGMGAVLGVLIDLVLVGRLQGKDAILGTTLLSGLSLGVVAKVISINMTPMTAILNIGSFPVLYGLTGLVMACAGGSLLGWLLFTDKGRNQLEKRGI